jgi:hypothetical protein
MEIVQGDNAGGVTTLAVSGQPQLSGDITLSAGSNIALLQVGQNIQISASISGTISVTSLTISTFTAGSVLFAGTGGLVSEDNPNLFWDDTNNLLYVNNPSRLGNALFSVGNNSVANGTNILNIYRGGNGTNSEVFRIIAGDGVSNRFSVDGEGNTFINGRITFGGLGGFEETVNFGGVTRRIQAVNQFFPLEIYANDLPVLFHGSGTTVTPVVIRGFASQSANLFEVQLSTTQIALAVNTNGRLILDVANGLYPIRSDGYGYLAAALQSAWSDNQLSDRLGVGDNVNHFVFATVTGAGGRMEFQTSTAQFNDRPLNRIPPPVAGNFIEIHNDSQATGLLLAGNNQVIRGFLTMSKTAAPGACTAALAGAGSGNLSNGAYSYKVTYVTRAGETEAGTVSNTVTVTDHTTNGQISLTNIPESYTAVIDAYARKIYRTVAGGTSYFLLTTLNNDYETTFTDNVADASLGDCCTCYQHKWWNNFRTYRGKRKLND